MIGMKTTYPHIASLALRMLYDAGMVHRGMPEGTYYPDIEMALEATGTYAVDNERLERWLSGWEEEALSIMAGGEEQEMEAFKHIAPRTAEGHSTLAILDDIYDAATSRPVVAL